MNKNKAYKIAGHVLISLLFVLLTIKLRQHFDLPGLSWAWAWLLVVIVFYWLGVFSYRSRAK